MGCTAPTKQWLPVLKTRSLTFGTKLSLVFHPTVRNYLFMKSLTPPPHQLLVLGVGVSLSQRQAKGHTRDSKKNSTHLFSSATSRAVQGTPRVIKEMLLMAGLTNARHVVTADRTQTTALNLPLNWWEQTTSISKGGFVWRMLTRYRDWWWECKYQV